MWFQGPELLLTVTQPSLLKELLLNKDGFLSRDVELGKKLETVLGKGLTFTDGEEWALHRRIVSPAFLHDRINVSYKTFPIYYVIFFSFFFETEGQHACAISMIVN